MNKEIKQESSYWEFPIDEAGEITGLKIPGIETFKDNTLLSLAKEICQNSLDAKYEDGKPVNVEFEKFEIKNEEFPGYDEFKSMISEQINFWTKTNNDKSTSNFFKKAKEILQNSKISCLRISDFNTTGLQYNNGDNFSGWKKLVKSKGVSDNKSTAGGSFGIGKFACFACSNLYTVFYSTKAIDGFEAYQGIARLSSFNTQDGKVSSGNGYYGAEKYSHKEGAFNINPKFQRSDYGTDIYILGFENRDRDWEDHLFASVIDNFMISIHNGELNFKIGNNELNKWTLNKFIEKYKSKRYEGLLNENTLDYYNIVIEKQRIHSFSKKLFEKDDIELKLFLAPYLRNRVAIIRSNGMKIFDQNRLPQNLIYSGILFLKGKKVNEYFRNLENPQHDGWSADRGEDKEKAEKKIKDIFRFIRDSIISLSKEIQPDTFDAEGVGEYLPDDEIETKGKKRVEDITDDIEKIGLEAKIPLKTARMLLHSGDGGRSKKRSKNKGKTKRTSGPGDNPNKNSEKLVDVDSARIFINKDGDYCLKFSINEEIESLRININISGETINEEIKITEAKKIKNNSETENLECKNNNIFIKKVNSHEYTTLIFKTKDKEKWAMEVKYYED